MKFGSFSAIKFRDEVQFFYFSNCFTAFLETDAAQHNTIVVTNSAKCADTLKESLLNYSQSVNAITEFTQAVEVKDIKHQWNAHVGKATTNVLGQQVYLD